jgi:hypothetical protein
VNHDYVTISISVTKRDMQQPTFEGLQELLAAVMESAKDGLLYAAREKGWKLPGRTMKPGQAVDTPNSENS